MSPERSQAYRRVVNTLSELGPSKLLAAEQDLIRYTADNLVFCSDLDEDKEALEALADTKRMFSALVESGRWEQVTATRLADDLGECGPARAAELQAAA